MKKIFHIIGVIFALTPLLATLAVAGEEKKQTLPAGTGQRPFDATRHSIPISEIEEGGPPRDGIPALFNPAFVSASDADLFLKKNDRVIGVVYEGEARAYPIKILNWHEAVNDSIRPVRFLVTW